MRIKDVPVGETFLFKGKEYLRVDLKGKIAPALDGNNVVFFTAYDDVDGVPFRTLRDGDWFSYQGTRYHKVNSHLVYNTLARVLQGIWFGYDTKVTYED